MPDGAKGRKEAKIHMAPVDFPDLCIDNFTTRWRDPLVAWSKRGGRVMSIAPSLAGASVRGVCADFLSSAQMVPRAGVEPARPFGQEILSLVCLPFHHRGAVGDGVDARRGVGRRQLRAVGRA